MELNEMDYMHTYEEKKAIPKGEEQGSGTGKRERKE